MEEQETGKEEEAGDTQGHQPYQTGTQGGDRLKRKQVGNKDLWIRPATRIFDRSIEISTTFPTILRANLIGEKQ